ncbi:MAG TPA: hypothetical protein VM818_12670 [Vicinamibacterales bacterium]|nr:hypothetical protein [Vicinamibacterales bacterium]
MASVPSARCRVLRAFCAATIVIWAPPAAAQETQRFAFDTVLSADMFVGENVSNRPQVIVDMSGAMRLSDNVQAYFRPWFRLPRPNTPSGAVPDWSKELWQAGLRYERPASGDGLATRVDVGYNISPIGLGVMDNRPSLNPTIAAHMSYVIPMPAFDPTVPRVSAIAGTYPLGAQVTVSSIHWDARGALLNSAPTRNYAVGRATRPRQTPVVVAGAGVTPFASLRVGAAIAYGNYATADEVTGPVRADRKVAMIAGEVEYALGFTKVSAEFIRSRFDRIAGSAIAYEYFVQGLQTMTPRWFVAGRHESTSAPPLITPTFAGARTRLAIVEGTVGFRLSPTVTLRGSYHTRKSYGAAAWDHQAAASAVWAQRWW